MFSRRMFRPQANARTSIFPSQSKTPPETVMSPTPFVQYAGGERQKQAHRVLLRNGMTFILMLRLQFTTGQIDILSPIRS